MKTKLLLLHLLLFSYISIAASLSVKKIEIAGKLLPPEKWNDISISENKPISFFFLIDQGNKEVLYKAFLNGHTVVVSMNENGDPYVELNSLQSGVYIFKAVAYDNSGWETESNPVSFVVTGNTVTEVQTIEPAINSTDNSNLYLIAIIAFHIVLFTTLFFRKRKKEKIEKDKVSEIKQQQGEEILSLKSELKKTMDENSYLKKQIQQMQASISGLQKANEALSVQNERLEKSKSQLEELQAEKEKLFAMTIHDIKNPASAINGYIELLDKYDLNAVEQQDILQSLAASSLQIINLSHKMTKVLTAKKKEEAEDLEIQSTSLKAVIDKVCKRNLVYAKNKNIKLINNASPHTPDVQIDVMKIDEVIDNYVNNAIKYSFENSTVKIVSYFSEKKVSVEVTDDGPGMTKYDIANAFNKGVTLSAKPTGGESSTGMGLWIVKQIIELHGGEVWIKSKPGQGATFGFNLPL